MSDAGPDLALDEVRISIRFGGATPPVERLVGSFFVAFPA
jgi:hypothetical protein